MTLSLSSIFILWTYRCKKEIKKRKYVEEQLRQSEEYFRTMFENAPIFIDSFDKNGKCILWNKECERVFGWTKDEINAHGDAFALFHPDPKQQEIMKEAFSSRKEEQYIEMYPITKNKETIHSEWINVNLSNGDIAYIGIDLRKQDEAEKEILAAQHKLQQLNDSLQERVKRGIEEIQKKERLLLQQSRLAQMGEMISMIAHQWRQPLGAISSAVFAMQTKIANGDRSSKELLGFVQKKLGNINTYVQFLSATTDDFRTFFKPNKEQQRIPITEPIIKALGIVATPLKDRGINITTEFLSTHQLYLYKNEMMQVILNILKNCEDHFLEKSISSPHIAISTKKEQESYLITISDNGGGIDEAIIETIFDPYFSTKDEKNGTGLGLYMSKIIVEEHNNGRLSVQNQNGGACFIITLYDLPKKDSR